MKKKLLALTLSLVLTLGLAVPAMAAEPLPTVPAGYTIVKVDGNIGESYGHYFHDGMMVVVAEVPADPEGYSKLTYLNSQGKLMLEMPCSDYDFSEGLAPVMADETMALGYIDTTGKMVIPTTLKMYAEMGQTLVGRFMGGNALVLVSNVRDQFGETITWRQIDRTGAAVPTTLDVNDQNNFCFEGGSSRGVTYDIVDINGVPRVLEFSEGYALLNMATDDKDASRFYVVSSSGVTPPAPVTAAPAVSKVLVNGKTVNFDAYVINQNNYFKLRDLAKAISGTDKQFDVTWNEYEGDIALQPNSPYTAVGGELTPGDGTAKTATVNTSAVRLEYTPAALRGYTIGGNNYFKLRDLCATFDIFVDWNGKTGTLSIDTTKGYVAE
ncbi:MAG: hypothetical protein RSB55_04535 [Oscillospiraceae bacterium]